MSSLRVEELRRAFDDSFARAPAAAAAEVDLLVVGVGREAVALRVFDLTSLHLVGRIARVPGTADQLLGLVAVRGRVFPTYDLASLLGRELARTAKWIAVVGTPSAALAFADLERVVRIPAAAVSAAAAPGRQPFVSSAARLAATEREPERLLPVVDVAAIFADLLRRSVAPGGGSTQ